MSPSRRAKLLEQALVFFLLVLSASCQLILEDVVDENAGIARKDAGIVKEATDPLTKTLQWAVDNSDLEGMAARAQRIREGKEEPMKLDREVMDAIFGSKVSYLQKSVDWVKESLAAGDEEKLIESLENLEEQVTDIDNANDLDNLGGVEPVVGLLSHPSNAVRTAAMWVIGTAAQSNPKAQAMLLNYRVLPKLMVPLTEATASTMVGADPKLLAKSLYAISTLLRGCGECLEAFLAHDGADQLREMLAVASRSEGSVPIKRKLVALVGDLVLEEVAPKATAALVKHFAQPSAAVKASQDTVTSSITRLLAVDDRELAEKSLQTLVNIVTAEPNSTAEMLGAGLPEILQVIVEKAVEKMQSEDDVSWEESMMLGRQLLETLKNETRNEM